MWHMKCSKVLLLVELMACILLRDKKPVKNTNKKIFCTLYAAQSGRVPKCLTAQVSFLKNFVWPQAWSLIPLPEVYTLYMGRAAGFEPELR
jgi:hypothetical protein